MANNKITLLTPIYNEADNIRPLFEAVKKTMDAIKPGIEWLYILVDDGSSDDSWEEINRLRKEWPDNVMGIRLSRNFGKEIALTAGLECMPEETALLCLDADMQHPPSAIPSFIEKWRDGVDIVVGIRQAVADYSLTKTYGSKLYYKIMHMISDIEIIPNSTDFRLLNITVVNELRRFTERTRMFRGLSDWLGFERDYVHFEAPPRLNDAPPAYNLHKLFALAMNSMASFSLFPLRLTGYLGLGVSILSALLMFFVIITDLFTQMVYTPTAYFLIALTFLLGVVLCALGMIALYIGHIHTEVVGRPLYVIRERTQKRSPQ